MSTITSKELLKLTGWSHPKLSRALKGTPFAWGAIPEVGRGGPPKLYEIEKLPEEIKLPVKIHRREQLAAQPENPITTAIMTAPPRRNGIIKHTLGKCSSPSTFNPATGEGLTKKESDRALLVSRLVCEYRASYEGKQNGAVLKSKKDFVDRYNQGAAGLFPTIYQTVGKTSFQSLERWDLSLRRKSDEPFALVDKRGKHLKGTTSITPEQESIIEIYAYHPNRLLDSEIIRKSVQHMKAAGVPCSQSEDTFRRYIERMRTKDFGDWVFKREGWKALNEKCLFHISRDYDAIEVGDIAFADGHVMNFECINPWTGKPKRMTLVLFYDMKSNYPLGWEIMPSENTQAISVALYRSILTLGKIPKIAYLDNGRAFRSQYFTGVKSLREIPEVGLFERLGMKSIFAWPYHAETKPIEGFFRIFGELERGAPSYSGTCIDTKPARMHRGEVIHRALYDALHAGRTPTIIDAHLAIAHWIDTEYAVRPQAGHLRGKTPLEVLMAGRGPGLAESDRVKLRLLMAEMAVKKIPRDGFKMPWSDKRYYHPDLFGRQNQSGFVRYDWADKNRIYVYDASGNFICEATQMNKVHPAAAHLGTETDVVELAEQIEMKRALAKSVTAPAREFIAAHVVPEVQRQIADICVDDGQKFLPEPKPVESELPLTPERCEEIDREYRELLELSVEPAKPEPLPAFELPPRPISAWDDLYTMRNLDRYEALLDLEARGETIPGKHLEWMSMFEKTEEYSTNRNYFEDRALLFQLLYSDLKKEEGNG